METPVIAALLDTTQAYYAKHGRDGIVRHIPVTPAVYDAIRAEVMALYEFRHTVFGGVKADPIGPFDAADMYLDTGFGMIHLTKRSA